MISAQRQQEGCADAEQASLEAVRTLVAEDFQLVNREIQHQVSSHVPLVETISSHIVAGGGKRLRPLTVLLVCRCLGNLGVAPAKLAVVIEFLHTATLLHDDVVDISPKRRGQETAFFRWGGAASVLVGDVLFSRAFELMIQLESLEILRQLSSATTKISEGEVAQLEAAGRVLLSESDYMNIIKAKTASLFEVSASTAAILSIEDPRLHEACKRFGLHFGIAYQLVDDWLDYSGDASRMGKEPGNDLLEGKLTLPVIHALANGSATDVTTIRDALRRRNPSLFPRVVDAVRRTGGLSHTQSRAKEHSGKAIEHISMLPDNSFREALISLIHFNLARQS